MAKAKKKTKKTSATKARTKKAAPKKAVGSKTATNLLSVGAKAPKFALPSDTGNTVSLKDFAGQTVVLYFYPKDNTPGCTQESCDFRDSFTRVQAKGAVVLGVSKDTVESHQRFKTKFSLPFPLLADTSGKMLEAYRVWGEKSLYGRKFMGITRTTYLIDVDAKGNGTIRKAYPKVKVTGHVDEVLNDLARK
ncbi:MAG: thioredoxin-dependent thiol peroxidase [Bdellovibrionales bacterium]|nr:thioredoxin-dependent thiol peroxidase [Bdellovibrionales bacterium]